MTRNIILATLLCAHGCSETDSDPEANATQDGCAVQGIHAVCAGGESPFVRPSWAALPHDAGDTATVTAVEVVEAGHELVLDGGWRIPLAAAPQLAAGDEVDLTRDPWGVSISQNGELRVFVGAISIESGDAVNDAFFATAEGAEVEVAFGDVGVTLTGQCAGDSPRATAFCPPVVGVLQHSLVIGEQVVDRGEDAETTLADGRTVAVHHEGIVWRDDRLSSDPCGGFCADFWMPVAAVTLTVTSPEAP